MFQVKGIVYSAGADDAKDVDELSESIGSMKGNYVLAVHSWGDTINKFEI